MAYEINININGDISSGGGETEGLSKSNTGSEQEKALKKLGKYISAQTVEPFIANVKNQISQNIELVTGNSELQQRVNFGFEVAQFGVSTYKNAQAGALIGSQLGIGGGAGAIIGLALTAISTAINIAFKQQQIDIQARLENYQLDQTRSRFGTAYNRSRSGNGV